MTFQGRFRRLPQSLLGLRAGVTRRGFARFYGSFETETGQTRNFGYQVRLNPRLSNRQKYQHIVDSVQSMTKLRLMPIHRRGQVFSSFDQLYGSRWYSIRRIIRYDAGVVYEE
jgi:hypothetical protein